MCDFPNNNRYDVSKMVSKAKVLPDGEFDHVNEGISLCKFVTSRNIVLGSAPSCVQQH